MATTSLMDPTVQLLSEAEEVRRRDRLAPFADRIELIVRAFERSSRPYRLGLGSWQREKEDIVRRYAEDYSLVHSSLPTGRARLRRGIEVDFDALAAEAARARALFSLPKTYRLPRHEREPFFREQIDALASAFDDRFVVEPGPERGNLFWFERFLEDYVVDYERLPSGKLRVAQALIPLSTAWYDLGVVDFDALRQVAGLPPDSGADVHWSGEPSS